MKVKKTVRRKVVKKLKLWSVLALAMAIVVALALSSCAPLQHDPNANTDTDPTPTPTLTLEQNYTGCLKEGKLTWWTRQP